MIDLDTYELGSGRAFSFGPGEKFEFTTAMNIYNQDFKWDITHDCGSQIHLLDEHWVAPPFVEVEEYNIEKGGYHTYKWYTTENNVLYKEGLECTISFTEERSWDSGDSLK